MFKKMAIGAALGASVLLTGCASVPMAPAEQDAAMKKFDAPTDGNAGMYVYRDSFIGRALKKTVSIDGKEIGKTANKVYFYKEVTPGAHTLSTQSEFGDNDLKFVAQPGKNYFFEQYITMGLLVGGANIKAISESEGMKEVRECELAKGN